MEHHNTKDNKKERRRYPRVNLHLVVSYTILKEDKILDVTQTKNISLGGILITTNREFAPDTNLSLKIRLPVRPEPFYFIGKVVKSRKIVQDLIYETHIELMALNKDDEKTLQEMMNLHLEKEGEI